MLGLHTCAYSETCVNEVGGYRCEAPEDSTDTTTEWTNGMTSELDEDPFFGHSDRTQRAGSSYYATSKPDYFTHPGESSS